MSNSFGQLLKLTTFGESHGLAIGGILEGFPAGFEIDLNDLQVQMNRRRPGQSNITTPRNESDQIEWLSGIFEGKSTGTPIGFIIKNNDPRSQDYDKLKDYYRPSHGDFTYQEKYGHRDYRGGGRTSARETACRVAAGALAHQFLKHKGIHVKTWVSQVGGVKLEKNWEDLNLDLIDSNEVRCPDKATADAMIAHIEQVKAEQDSVGGIISGVILGLPAGVGEPVFDKLQARLAYAMLGINAVKGFEYGAGFSAASSKGSLMNDPFLKDVSGKIITQTNHSGGIQGGLSNGMPVTFQVAFKPVATIGLMQDSVDQAGNAIKLAAKGRHDPCVVPRAVPIVEAMAALVAADLWLLNQVSKM